MQEKTIFLETLGDYPALRVIDFLICYASFDYSITEIARNSNVHFITFQKIWPGFLKKGFVKKTRKRGKNQLYSLNKESPVIKRLMELDNFLCKQAASEALEKHKKNNDRKLVANVVKE